jgi:hypothetical protein
MLMFQYGKAVMSSLGLAWTLLDLAFDDQTSQAQALDEADEPILSFSPYWMFVDNAML